MSAAPMSVSSSTVTAVAILTWITAGSHLGFSRSAGHSPQRPGLPRMRRTSAWPQAAGDAEGRRARDVSCQLKSYRGGRIPDGIRDQPDRWPESARPAVRPRDLAQIVVVAQAAGPGTEGLDRRAPGGPGSSAVRYFGALA